MARIRSVHPGLWTDEAFVSVSRDARLLFIGLLNECDDQGAFEWKPLQLRMRLCAADPVDVATVSAWLNELAGANLLRRYEVKGGNYGAVRNFREWQRPKKPNAVHPMAPELRTYAGPKAVGSEPDGDERGAGGELSRQIPLVGSEPEPSHGGACPPPVPNRFPTSGEKPPQMEDGGGGEERPSLRSGDAVAPPRAAGSDPPDARAALFRDGLAALRRLTGKPDGPARALLGKLLKSARDDCAGLLTAILAAAESPPAEPVAWLSAAAARLGGGPLLAIQGPPAGLELLPPEMEPPDAFGLRPWVFAQPGTCVAAAQDGARGYALHGIFVEELGAAIANSCGSKLADRVDWSCLAEWCRDDVPMSPHFLPTVRRVAASVDGPIRSMKLFDAAVREAVRRAA
jgi:hypothetical protein